MGCPDAIDRRGRTVSGDSSLEIDACFSVYLLYTLSSFKCTILAYNQFAVQKEVLKCSCE
jgi:hypothetical protein